MTTPRTEDDPMHTDEEYVEYGVVQYRRGRAQAEAEAAAPLRAALDGEGVVAEMIGAESAIQDGLARLRKATNTLGALVHPTSGQTKHRHKYHYGRCQCGALRKRPAALAQPEREAGE